MKLALIGYGKMGKAVAEAAKERGHEVILIIDVDNKSEFRPENIKKADVVLEFTTPSSAYENILKCIEAGVPVVSGTTGWTDKLPEIKEKVIREGGSFFYSPNFSLGVNIMFKLNEYLSRIMSKFPEYTVSITEKHHIHKLDAPSGTAIKIAEGIIKNMPQKQRWSLTEQGEDIIPIKAIREGEILGVHQVLYTSDNDYLLIEHSLKSRKALAEGAIMAAEFLKDKKGFYTFDDLLNI